MSKCFLLFFLFFFFSFVLFIAVETDTKLTLRHMWISFQVIYIHTPGVQESNQDFLKVFTIKTF